MTAIIMNFEGGIWDGKQVVNRILAYRSYEIPVLLPDGLHCAIYRPSGHTYGMGFHIVTMREDGWRKFGPT